MPLILLLLIKVILFLFNQAPKRKKMSGSISNSQWQKYQLEEDDDFSSEFDLLTNEIMFFNKVNLYFYKIKKFY